MGISFFLVNFYIFDELTSCAIRPRRLVVANQQQLEEKRANNPLWLKSTYDA